MKEKYLLEACDEYIKRLSRFAKTDIIEIADEKIPDKASEKQENQIKERESAAVLAKIPSGSFVVALCIEGGMMSSEKLAQTIEKVAMQYSHIVFLIGGSLGLSDSVKRRADLQLSFSPMTFPHRIMRVILLEQIYRACKINANEAYHK
jgi:23S rRNA (pseudouridine1915-N3)-methyltransferase